MSEPNNSFKQYYKNGNYKGFYNIRERVFKLSAKTNMTFSDGEKEFFASGQFKEAVLEKIFKKIDSFLSDRESSKENSTKIQYS